VSAGGPVLVVLSQAYERLGLSKMPPQLLYTKRAKAHILLGQKDKVAKDPAPANKAGSELCENAPFVKH